jgi:hypothetical protein
VGGLSGFNVVLNLLVSKKHTAFIFRVMDIIKSFCYADHLTVTSHDSCWPGTPRSLIPRFFNSFDYVPFGPGSSVGIVTGYGLKGPGIGSRCGARFSAPVQTGPGAHPAPCTMGTGSFRGKERPG